MLSIVQNMDGTYTISVSLNAGFFRYEFKGTFERVDSESKPDPSGLRLEVRLGGVDLPE